MVIFGSGQNPIMFIHSFNKQELVVHLECVWPFSRSREHRHKQDQQNLWLYKIYTKKKSTQRSELTFTWASFLWRLMESSPSLHFFFCLLECYLVTKAKQIRLGNRGCISVTDKMWLSCGLALSDPVARIKNWEDWYKAPAPDTVLIQGRKLIINEKCWVNFHLVSQQIQLCWEVIGREWGMCGFLSVPWLERRRQGLSTCVWEKRRSPK